MQLNAAQLTYLALHPFVAFQHPPEEPGPCHSRGTALAGPEWKEAIDKQSLTFAA